jgi:TetR/AcrR family transcriptional repressor of nem operon
LNNLVQEMAPIDSGFRRRLRSALNLWIDGLEAHIRRGQQAGFIKCEVDARQVAHFVVMMHEGMFGMLKGLGDTLAFGTLFASVRAYLRSIEAPH